MNKLPQKLESMSSAACQNGNGFAIVKWSFYPNFDNCIINAVRSFNVVKQNYENSYRTMLSETGIMSPNKACDQKIYYMYM